MITKDSFGAYERYTIASDELALQVTTMGATALSLKFKGQETILGYATPDEYFSHTGYIGALVGRYANRIKGARFALNGREYALTPNEHANQLHGGPHAFHQQTWKAEVKEAENAVVFTYLSPDGENGYPGNLTAKITYIVNGAHMTILFEGDTDADTIYAPTTHMFFNLDGDQDIRQTQLQIPADRYLTVDSELIPVKVVKATGVYDFNDSRMIGQDYDTCFILDPEQPPVAMAQAGHIRMTLRTDYPALQLYTGQRLPLPHHPYQGFALEPEVYPDTPNHPEFPTAVLRKEQHFKRVAEYDFATV